MLCGGKKKKKKKLRFLLSNCNSQSIIGSLSLVLVGIQQLQSISSSHCIGRVIGPKAQSGTISTSFFSLASGAE
jgi:hypothetical protein